MAPCCKDLYIIPGSWKHPSSCTASILTRHVTHWTCLRCSGSAYTTACSSSWQYPATSHSHWRGVDQHPTINNLINSMWRRGVALREANGGHGYGWMDYLGKGEVFTNTDLDRFVIFFLERNRYFVYMKIVLDLWVAFCVYNFVQYISMEPY